MKSYDGSHHPMVVGVKQQSHLLVFLAGFDSLLLPEPFWWKPLVSRLSSPCTLIALRNVIDIVFVTVEAVEFFREFLSMASSALLLIFSLANECACRVSLHQGQHRLDHKWSTNWNVNVPQKKSIIFHADLESCGTVVIGWPFRRLSALRMFVCEVLKPAVLSSKVAS